MMRAGLPDAATTPGTLARGAPPDEPAGAPQCSLKERPMASKKGETM
jgi:hypothetical protein